jgi:hypothetical protein
MRVDWTWLVMIASLVGTVANIRQRRWCFAVWILTNAAWMANNIHIGQYAQAARDLVYLGLSAWRLLAWRNR